MSDLQGMMGIEEATRSYERERPRLFALAYRMLGSAADAEDALQDAWLRLQQVLGTDRAPHTPGAWLHRTTSRLALDRLRRRQREPYPGPWLPEPVVLGEMPDEDAGHTAPGGPALVEQGETLTLALLHLFERLTPEERVTLVLREVVGDDFRTIGEIVGARDDACRQYYHRGRRRLADLPRFDPPDAEATGRIVQELLTALEQGDRAAVRAALDDEALAVHDGGGVVSAAIRPIEGPDRITQVYAHLYQRLGRQAEFRLVSLLGETALAVLLDGRLDSINTVRLRHGRIAMLCGVRNPHKLAAATRALEVPPPVPP